MAGDKEGQNDIARWEGASFVVEGEGMLWRKGRSGRNDGREGRWMDQAGGRRRAGGRVCLKGEIYPVGVPVLRAGTELAHSSVTLRPSPSPCQRNVSFSELIRSLTAIDFGVCSGHE